MRRSPAVRSALPCLLGLAVAGCLTPDAGAEPAAPVPPAAAAREPDLVYVKRATREESKQASIEATLSRLGPIRQSPWRYIGPFDNDMGKGMGIAYPPEAAIDLSAEYEGADGLHVRWADGSRFKDGQVHILDIFNRPIGTICYLTRTVDVEGEGDVLLSLASDDALVVWLNGVVAHQSYHPRRLRKRERDLVPVHLKRGANRLLLKAGHYDGQWRFFYDLLPMSPALMAGLERRLDADFPSTDEGTYYRMETIVTPPGVSLEVGGLGFMAGGGASPIAGALMVGTRRGEIWAFHPGAGSPAGGPVWTLFAAGLHEALGLVATGPGEVCIVQRPELTRVRDMDGDGAADRFETVCDAWGISGNYHEFSFGPARDAEGNFWGTLNLAHHKGSFGEMDSIAPWRGWTFKVTPQGGFVPWSSGLRSPNGIGVSPEGDVFYAENQGGYVGTSFIAHVTRGAFHGHPAGLVWDRTFPGEVANVPVADLAAHRKAPSVLIPHGNMGHSPSQPVWDTTGGAFGPFAGQLFVGDQTMSLVNRIFMEKVGGEWQGAVFPFRRGFQSGVNRLAFAPDGGLYAGETDRGWGATGGKPFGLQRVAWTGRTPMEIQAMRIGRDGFDLTFTMPVDPASASDPGAWSAQHFHYEYRQAYGSPVQDATPVAVRQVRISEDRRRVGLVLPDLRTGVIYEVHAQGVRAADGSELLHPDAWYTVNRKFE